MQVGSILVTHCTTGVVSLIHRCLPTDHHFLQLCSRSVLGAAEFVCFSMSCKPFLCIAVAHRQSTGSSLDEANQAYKSDTACCCNDLLLRDVQLSVHQLHLTLCETKFAPVQEDATELSLAHNIGYKC